MNQNADRARQTVQRNNCEVGIALTFFLHNSPQIYQNTYVRGFHGEQEDTGQRSVAENFNGTESGTELLKTEWRKRG